jgi:isoquinoline 1-oxidoreductase subunit alpha
MILTWVSTSETAQDCSTELEDHMASLTVNGTVREVEAEPDTPLLWVIREQIGLTGTKYGCGIAQCGSCTVHVDGVATRSCSVPISAITPDQQIVTIEGLSPDVSHPLQKAWLELDVPQCGYCQTGQIMTAAALLAANPKPTDEQIAAEMSNICRCGTYNRIKAAINLAASSGTGRG